MKIAVIDGQGGGIGREIVEKLNKKVSDETQIIALGTNSAATAAMIKAGAYAGATGENAIILNAGKVDIIAGAIGIILSNSMMGEVSEKMACAISTSAAIKILIPINRCNVTIIGVDTKKTIPALIEEAVELILHSVTK